MSQAHGALSGVDALAAGAAGAEHIGFYIVGADFHFHFFRFGHHRHGGGGGMDTPLGFRIGNALNAMNSAFVFQSAVSALAADEADDFLHTADIGDVAVHHFHFPALFFRVAGIHFIEIVGKKRRFLAADGRADLHNGVFRVVGVFGQKQYFKLFFPFFQLFFQVAGFFFGHGLHFRVVFFLQKFHGAVVLFFQLFISAIALDNIFQLRMGHHIFFPFGLIIDDLGIADPKGKFIITLFQLCQFFKHTAISPLYVGSVRISSDEIRGIGFRSGFFLAVIKDLFFLGMICGVIGDHCL